MMKFYRRYYPRERRALADGRFIIREVNRDAPRRLRLIPTIPVINSLN